ncbi:TonB-dependent receptor [Povalibacter sp.]|uniref:TonB-dependent receptor n=1 Tax=Povalibacter sp. TaxID=1962978 RepID=UPI002F402A15
MTIRPIGLFSALAVLASSNSVFAKGAEGYTARATLEEVTVTARRRAENLQDVPISIDVFSTADIEAKSVTSLRELSAFTPNFSMYNNGNDGALTSEVFMRGIGNTIGNSVGGPGVGIYLDGVYLSTQQAIDLGLMDLERVEVLRGPQGTLFGRNTVGGAVSFVTARPTADFFGTAEVTFGSYDRLDAKINLNGALIPGRLNGRIAVGTQNKSGYGKVLDYSTGRKIDEMGDRDRISGRVLLDWILSDDISILFSAEAMDLDEKGTVRTVGSFTPNFVHNTFNAVFRPVPPLNAGIVPRDVFTTYGPANNFNKMDSLGGSVTLDWSLTDVLSIKLITAYREYTTAFGVDFDFSPHNIGSVINYTDQEQFSQEFQLNGASFDDRLDWVMGLYSFSEKVSDPSDARIFEPLTAAGLIADSSFRVDRWSDNKNLAAFGEGTFAITDKLNFTAGLRYTVDKQAGTHQQSDIQDGGFDCAACLAPLGGKTRTSDWTGRASVAYKWNQDVMTYVSAAQGLKSGGLTPQVTSPVRDERLKAFLPEHVWTYELGTKSTLFDRRLRLNAAFFYSDYSDIQYSFNYTSIVNGTIVPVKLASNAPSAEIKGFEVDMLLEPVENLTFTAGVGLTDAKYTEADARGGPLKLDSEFVFTPKWSYALASEYKIPTAWGNWSARVDYAWRSKVYFEVQNTTNPMLQQQAYGIVNARINLDLSAGWSLSAFGTNLTDELYMLSAYSQPGLGLNALFQPAIQREWGLTAKYSF